MNKKRMQIAVSGLLAAWLLAGCGFGQPNTATLVAEAMAQTQAVEHVVQTALAGTLTAASTSTVTIVESPTSTATQAPLPDWSGSWRIWMEGLTETEIGPSYFEVTITQAGGQVSLPLAIEGDTLTFSGPLSGDHLSATGVVTYSGSGASGAAFAWFLAPSGDQFSGNWGGKWFCGARNGAAKPSPCYAP